VGFFFRAEDGIRDRNVTGVQTCALPICSPGGRGVVAVYIFGTIFGAIFMGLASGFLASVLPLSPLSFAMATGIGSGSMTAAALAPLISSFPEMEDTIIAFSGASNLATSVT